MKRLGRIWTGLRESLWFVPGTMLVLSLIAAFALVELDTLIARDALTNFPRLFGLSAEGSRGMLTAIASSMLTVAALSFSLTLSAVAQASSLYSPRVIRNFLRDRANQFILGYFVSVFVYCLIVLRTIRGGDEGTTFIPSVAVITGLILALGGVIVLVFFIHHIAESLQVTHIIKQIFTSTRAAIDKMYPEKVGVPAAPDDREEALRKSDEREWTDVPAQSSGYVQDVYADALKEFAIARNVVMRLKCATGDFIASGAPLAGVTGADRERIQLNDEDINEVNGMFAIGWHRTIEQDAGFGIQQMVDIALRALSPGINDTTTALNCIDRLGEIAGLIAERDIPTCIRTLDGEVVVEAKAPDFDDYISSCFDQVRSSAEGKLVVFMRMADAIIFAAGRTSLEPRRRLMIKHLHLTEEYARRTLRNDYEKEKFAEFVADKEIEAR